MRTKPGVAKARASDGAVEARGATLRVAAIAAAALFLLLGQLFAAAHAASEDAASPDHASATCALCIAADRTGDAVAPDPATVAVQFSDFEPPSDTSPAALSYRLAPASPSRAPPAR